MAKNKEMVNLWDRQEGETAKQYEAFCIYRNMGIERSQRKVSEQLGKSEALMSRWASLNNWTERVTAYDEDQERLARKLQQREIAKMRQRHAKIAADMLSKAAEALEAMNAYEINSQGLSRMVEVATKIERISRGDVGDVVEERPSAEPAAPAVQFYIPSNNRDNDSE